MNREEADLLWELIKKNASVYIVATGGIRKLKKVLHGEHSSNSLSSKFEWFSSHNKVAPPRFNIPLYNHQEVLLDSSCEVLTDLTAQSYIVEPLFPNPPP